jgi:uncharacterized membrane protein
LIIAAFLSHLVQITSTSESNVQDSELAAYRLLLYVPAEYFTKAARAHFVRRAYTADLELVKLFKEKGKKNQGSESQKLILRNLITVRVFLRRVIKLVGFERISVSTHFGSENCRSSLLSWCSDWIGC